MGFQNLTGQTIGQYELGELLGIGGMGAVYRAHQRNLSREVAFKVLNLAIAANAEDVERFNREAKTAASLEHPHIIPIYDYGSRDGITFLAMRLLQGGSLAERLKQHADIPTSLGEAADLLRQLSGALDYAHSRNVIHRDIKSSNVMFDTHGTAYLLDFGIAKVLEGSAPLTASGIMMGTPTHMPPEQWRGDPITPAADQYALGVMMYEVLTGRVPFEASTPYGLMAKHLNDMPTPPQLFRADIPQSVAATLEKAMAKDPADRFQTAADFSQAFDAAIIGVEGQASQLFTFRLERAAPLAKTPPRPTPVMPELPTVVPTTEPTVPRRNPLRRPLIVGGTAVLLLVIVIALVWQATANQSTLTEAAHLETQAYQIYKVTLEAQIAATHTIEASVTIGAILDRYVTGTSVAVASENAHQTVIASGLTLTASTQPFTATSLPVITPTATLTSTPSFTPSPTSTDTLEPTATPTATENIALTVHAVTEAAATGTRVAEQALDAQDTLNAQATLYVPTNTPQPSDTLTATLTSTATPSPSATPTDTLTFTPTPTSTFTAQPTPTPTETLDQTATADALNNATATQAAIVTQLFEAAQVEQATLSAQIIATQVAQTMSAITALTNVPTLTPSPSVTLTMTATPTPTDSQVIVSTLAPLGVISSTGDVNMRGGPGTGYDTLRKLSSGTQVTVIEQSPDTGWYHVQLGDSTEGWVASQFLSVIGTPTPTPLPATLIALAQGPIGRNSDWYPLVETFDDVEMVLVPAGCFIMGNENEFNANPTKRICFDKPFWIDRYEAYFSSMDRTPLIGSWPNANTICLDRNKRLPTEAEWEYAARGPSDWAYPWGNTFNVDNIFVQPNHSITTQIGSKPAGASWVGAMDMIGNAAEWVSSLYWPYPYDANDGRENPTDTTHQRSLRGEPAGSYSGYQRQWNPPTAPNGFRCARDYQN